MILKKTVCFLVYFFIGLEALPQVNDKSFQEKLQFSRFLNNNGFYKQKTWLFNRMLAEKKITVYQRDTLLYLKAQNFLKKDEHIKAIHSLDSIKKIDFSLFARSRLLQGYLYDIEKEHNQAYKAFNKVKTDKDTLKALQRFGLKASSLLAHQFRVYDSLQKSAPLPDNPVFYQEEKLQGYYEQYQAIPHHSKFLAGFLSAVIPGAGKAYVGDWKKGVGNFFPNLLLGFQAFEGYYHKGLKSPRFILFGSLFTVFYVGNIWGSVLNVKIKQQQLHEKIDRQILLDLHIPFDQLCSSK